MGVERGEEEEDEEWGEQGGEGAADGREKRGEGRGMGGQRGLDNGHCGVTRADIVARTSRERRGGNVNNIMEWNEVCKIKVRCKGRESMLFCLEVGRGGQGSKR